MSAYRDGAEGENRSEVEPEASDKKAGRSGGGFERSTLQVQTQVAEC